ncbi:hypothetical protein [Altericista sp. CCNU0014]
MTPRSVQMFRDVALTDLGATYPDAGAAFQGLSGWRSPLFCKT